MPKREGAGRPPKKDKPPVTRETVLDDRWKKVQDVVRKTTKDKK